MALRSGGEVGTRFGFQPVEQAARHIVRQLGRRQFLVKPTPEPRSGERVSETPSYTTLDTTRLREELKRLPPDVWSTINAAVGL